MQGARELAIQETALSIGCAGHKKPELPDDPATIAQTAQYLRDFNRLEAQTATATELYDRMLELYPRRANPGSLWGGAKTAKP